MESAGLHVERVHQVNKVSIMAWWFPGKLLRRKRISKPVLKIFDKTAWLWKRIDPILPWPGLSLIVVARKQVPRPRKFGPLQEVARPSSSVPSDIVEQRTS